MKVAGNNLKSSILKENNKFLFLQEKKENLQMKSIVCLMQIYLCFTFNTLVLEKQLGHVFKVN